MKVLLVAPNVSMRMGGEAALPAHLLRELRRIGVEADVLTHARVREELCALFPREWLHFVEDTSLERALDGLGRRAPRRVRDIIFNSAIGVSTMARLAGHARALCVARGYDVVHQAGPVSPQYPSMLSRLPAPVMIGPMNGAMDYPPALKARYSGGSQAAVRLARALARAANALWRGKRDAALLLAANERTADGLPHGVNRAKVEILVENGVDLSLWRPLGATRPATPTFVYVGRLVWWKAIDILIDAFGKMRTPARLVIIGDGEDRPALERQAEMSADVLHPIEFTGFLSQPEICAQLSAATALVLPSVREAGGAVILEGFACGVPAVATGWGGPCDYITPQTGVLIRPDSREAMVEGFAAAMDALAGNPQQAEEMGRAARRRAEAEYSWEQKARRFLALYVRIADAARRPGEQS